MVAAHHWYCVLFFLLEVRLPYSWIRGCGEEGGVGWLAGWLVL